MTKTQQARLANKYRLAAELFDARKGITGCCQAISIAGASRFSFEALFKDDAWGYQRGHGRGHGHAFYFETISERDYYPEVRQRRVMGLLWAALMVEEGVVG